MQKTTMRLSLSHLNRKITAVDFKEQEENEGKDSHRVLALMPQLFRE